jgi:hypothetical protein
MSYFSYRCRCDQLLYPEIIEELDRCPFCKRKIKRSNNGLKAGIQEIQKEIRRGAVI